MSQCLKNPTSNQSGHCFLCSTEILNTNLNSHRRNLCERFCILVGRYLNLNIESNSKSSNFKFEFKQTLNKHRIGNELEVFCCCDSCFVEVEIFCVVFEQFSVIQLELNARLGKFAQLIKKKNEAVQRQTDFVVKFGNAVVSRVRSGYRNFPHLQITNPKPDIKPKNTAEIELQLHQEGVSDEVTDGIIIKKEETAWSPRPITHSNDLHLPFKCRICGKGFTLGRYRRRHEIRHAKPFSCRFCDRRFAHKVALEAHEKEHTDAGSTPQFMCCVCKRSFLRINDCKNHITKVHNKIGKILKIIKKTKWQTDSELPLPSSSLNPIESVDKPNTDRKDDYDNKPFKCLVCGKGFFRLKYQLRHQVIHKEARPYECPYCEQAFKHRQTLQRHKLTHLGIKPFQCGLCGVKFSRLAKCKLHQKKEHGVTDGVINREIVTIPNETENSDKNSAQGLEEFLFYPTQHAASAAEQPHYSIQEDIGNGILPPIANSEVEPSEPRIIFPKSEPFEGGHTDGDLCDPLADL